MKEDKIKISGEDNKIEIEDGKRVEIKGDDNVIRIEEGEKVEIKGDDNVIEISGEEKDIKIKDRIPEIKKALGKTVDFFKQKKVINIIIVVLLLLLLIGSSQMRLQNLPLLVDSTTGEYIPLALDPFYFLRVAETMISGDMPDYDAMRYPSLHVGFTQELLPRAVVFLYKIISTFSKDVTLRFVDVISPVIFFALGLIAFFFLIFVLTRSKWIALISSFFLAIIPTYLYRTLAGFADHESIGMFAFFLAFLSYSLALKFLNKEKKDKLLLKSVLFGLIVGFFSTFSMVSWGGSAIFLFMIFPLSFLIFWLIKSQESEKTYQLKAFILFYVAWIISSILFGPLFGSGMNPLLGRFILGSTGLISLFVLGYIIIDYILINKIHKIKFMEEKFRQAYSFIIVAILGGFGLLVVGKSVFSMILNIWNKLLHPFGQGRVGLTIAENAQPYLVNWIGQTGKIMFWIFILGLVFIGIEIAKGIKSKKHKYGFVLVWIIMFSGILFSRISANSLFNGTNFISQAFYLIGLILFVGYTIKLYLKKEIKLGPEIMIIASWMFFMLISARSAIRFFFALTPFVCFIVGYSVVKLFDYLKKSKDELLRIMLFLLFGLVVVGLIISSINFTKSSMQQAKYTGPSANYQWQHAMSWVRDNTPQESIFIHWWDYGYWVQYLGERATVTDGGHANGFWDHLIGRYVLTTPYPETAISFMKAHNVSYLLIDPTDLGKYPAYSKIGGDENHDRFSSIPIISYDPSQIKETSTGTIRIYRGGWGIDEDIIYNQNGTEIFLPGPTYDEIGNPIHNTFVIGIILETSERDNQSAINQPNAIFVYNNKQIEIPLKYVYYQGKLLDFKSGLDAVFQIIPKISPSGQGVEIDEFGSGIYLSPKVSKSLVAQLYLLEDVSNLYNGIKLVHTESSPVVANLKSQGLYLGEFIDYQGFRGPIKIWEIGENPNIIERKEFLREMGEYAEFDDLEFVK